MPASNYIPISKLKDKADKVFSKFVRQRDADMNGVVRCCTCGKIDHWKNMHCGHYRSRRYLAVRYDEWNVGVQCPKCNLFAQGEQVEFRNYLVKRYGEYAVNIIDLKYRNTVNDSRMLYETVIEKYK